MKICKRLKSEMQLDKVDFGFAETFFQFEHIQDKRVQLQGVILELVRLRQGVDLQVELLRHRHLDL